MDNAKLGAMGFGTDYRRYMPLRDQNVRTVPVNRPIAKKHLPSVRRPMMSLRQYYKFPERASWG